MKVITSTVTYQLRQKNHKLKNGEFDNNPLSYSPMQQSQNYSGIQNKIKKLSKTAFMETN